jgi:hypothetical protein
MWAALLDSGLRRNDEHNTKCASETPHPSGLARLLTIELLREDGRLQKVKKTEVSLPNVNSRPVKRVVNSLPQNLASHGGRVPFA